MSTPNSPTALLTKKQKYKVQKNTYHKDERAKAVRQKKLVLARIGASDEKGKEGDTDDSKAVKEWKKIMDYLDEQDAALREKDELIAGLLEDEARQAYEAADALEAENEALKAKIAALEAQMQ